MPRPQKSRKVCSMPKTCVFYPHGEFSKTVTLTVDEYESIRLIDKQGFSQEECAGYMKVARTTAQQIYNTAREKIATALVEGCAIKIEGGTYCLCSGEEKHCKCGGCEKHCKGI